MSLNAVYKISPGESMLADSSPARISGACSDMHGNKSFIFGFLRGEVPSSSLMSSEFLRPSSPGGRMQSCDNVEAVHNLEVLIGFWSAMVARQRVKHLE